MRRKIRAGLTAASLALAFMVAVPTAHGQLNIQFDYTYDTGNFFGQNPQAVTLLNDAAQFFESHIATSLSAIDPVAQSAADGQSDTWTIDSFNPADPGNSSADIQITNLTVATNTIIVYVGGATSFPGSELGLGGPGGYGDMGSTNWVNIVGGRGQAGALATIPTQFSPWGGSVAFSSTANWYFDTDPSTDDVPAGKNDFYSVALHELGHVLGIGTAGVIDGNGTVVQPGSWVSQISGGNFTGANSEALNGGNPVPLDPGLGHWADGTESNIFFTNVGQEAAMDPTLTVGTRKYFTDLDMAGLQDVGWDVIPEPAAWPWLASASVLGLSVWRRKNSPLNHLSTA